MNINHAALTQADLPPPDPNGDPAGDQAASGFGLDDADEPAWLKRRASLLERLAERGVDVADELPALARAQSQLAEAVTECLRKATPEGRAALGELAVTLHQGNVDFALMYERISRSVRRCIAMREDGRQRRAAAARDAAGAGPRPRASGERAEAHRDPEAEAARDMAAGLTGELDAERPEQLFGDLYDRPEDPTGMADLGLDRPLKELVAEICADFGVDGKIWTERLGLGGEMAPALADGKRRPHARRRRPKTSKTGTAAPPKTTTPTAPLEKADPGRRPPDRPIADDPGSCAETGGGSRNRRERCAALKLARKRPPPALHAASDRHPNSGCGPPRSGARA